MRKLMGVTAALLLLTAGNVAAQTATGTVGASAQVLASLTADNAGDLSFGAAIAPTPGDITVAPGSATAGAIVIQHNSAFSTAVSTVSAVLTRGGGTDLPVVFNCAYGTGANSGTIGGTEAACGSMANRAVTTLGTSQTTYLQVGGVLTIPANVEPGTYTGNISFLFTATGF